jgi:hypothetical protein
MTSGADSAPKLKNRWRRFIARPRPDRNRSRNRPFEPPSAQLVLVLVILYIPKAFQEWILHYEELHPWQWLRSVLFGVPEH